MNRREFLGGVAGVLGGSRVLAHQGRWRPKRARRGVNLSGAEFGTKPEFCNEAPGQFGKDYTYNSERTVAYFAREGLGLIRLPFRWERLQPRLGEAFDEAELGRLREFVGWAKRHGATVVPEPHNFGRYRLRLGGKVVEAIVDQTFDGERPVTRDHFADFWRRFSDVFRDDPTVEAYGLMNEPHDMGRSDWKAISQAAVTAIRAGGDRKLVLVPGNSYSNSDHFADINGPRAWIRDPAGRLAYEAHCYFDSDYSGTYALSYDAELAKDKDLESRGVRRLRQFAEWCSTNRVPGFLGEFAVPGDDPRWLKLVEHCLEELDRIGMDACWWAAGEWWGPYKLSLQPHDDFRNPAPQMAALRRRAGG
jgi:endoglucanase